MKYYFRVIPIALILSFNSCLNVCIPNTRQFTMNSAYTQAKYSIHIALPQNYTKNKPTTFVFVLDDSYAFPTALAIARHLQERNYFEPVVIVGIAYSGKETPNSYRLNRTRDYTPWPMLSPEDGYGAQYMNISGGASAFQIFLANELFPKLEKNFSIKDKILVGHSLGGLFGVFDALTNQLFNDYLLISPSLWYNQKKILSLWKEHDKSLLPRIFFAAGSLENQGHNIYQSTQDFYQSYNASGGKSSILLGDGLDHSTIFPPALTEGLITLLQQK